MRPRKVLLIFDPSVQRLSELKFTLETMGKYRVLSASNIHEAIAFFLSAPIIDLVLASDGGLGKKLKGMAPYVPMIVVCGTPGDIRSEFEKGYGDAVVTKNISTAELLERIKVMAQRKRGPRKGSPEAMRCGKHMKRLQSYAL